MAVTGKLARVVLFLLIFPHFPPSAFSPPSPSCSLSHFLSLSLWPLSAWPTGAQPVVCFSTHSAWHVHVWWLARLLLASIYFPSSSLATTNNIREKHIKFTSSSPTLSCCHPSPSMCLWLEILGTFLFHFEFFLLLWNLFGIFIFDCMQVWNGFLSLFLLLLSLFCFFPVIFLDLRYIGMTCQSAVCARFVSLSFSCQLLSHLLVCDWFILIYFLFIFWLWVSLYILFFFISFFIIIFFPFSFVLFCLDLFACLFVCSGWWVCVSPGTWHAHP